jgi:hypothetical protein
MNEQEWVASKDPAEMLAFLREGWSGQSVRRREWPGLSDRKLRLWVEACRHACGPRVGRDWRPLDEVSSMRAMLEFWSGGTTPLPKATRAALLRCVAGNPFRPAYVVHRSGNEWSFDTETSERLGKRCVSIGMIGHCVLVDREWLTPTVLSLSQAAYDEPLPDGTLDPFRLAVLADALEEAGCVLGCTHCVDGVWGEYNDDARTPIACSTPSCAVLAHLRSAGPHFRGCWVIDLLLGKS